ncbi:hypothetical protein EVA_12990 [gut metagenome]|uniref:Uncharacterized protein n=1 Tax=gut metagenome TaxID=749906 RepID=J9CFT9_9ZZZZ
MLDGMDSPLSKHWFTIRQFHSYIKGRHGFTTYHVLA